MKRESCSEEAHYSSATCFAKPPSPKKGLHSSILPVEKISSEDNQWEEDRHLWNGEQECDESVECIVQGLVPI